MTQEPAIADAEAALAYSYRPSLLGAPWEFKLTEHGLDWVAGRRSGRILYSEVRRLRLSFKPVSMQTLRFLTEIWAEGAPKLEIVSSSWKSMVEQERQNQPYAAFITELHARVARASRRTPVRYDRGFNPFSYWPGLALFAVVSVALALLVVRALQAHALSGAIFIFAFVALFVWQGGNFFRRNRPGSYRPDALPADLMPKV